MLQPHERIAAALRSLTVKLDDGVYRSGQISRREFDLLEKTGYLTEIIKGWYFASNPNAPGGATMWHGHYWPFVAQYLASRFGDAGYVLAAESSLLIHAGLTNVPGQLIVMTQKAGSSTQALPYDTSLVMYGDTAWSLDNTAVQDGLRILDLEYALSRSSDRFFAKYPIQAAALLQTSADVNKIGRLLAERGGAQSVYANRLIGALRHVGRGQDADYLKKSLERMHVQITEVNPFEISIQALNLGRRRSPYAARIQLMWANMREAVERLFPPAPGLPVDKQSYLDRVKKLRVSDAYHSLSIEGYRVTEELIQRIENGLYSPDRIERDRQDHDAMAAKGYVLAADLVTGSIGQILGGRPAGHQVARDYRAWYQELFSPFVEAGTLKASDLFGFRGHQVYIHGSQHVPIRVDAVADAMDALMQLIQNEPNPAVNAVLGHFFFGFIHPFSDGNGRISRFLMNALFAGGGYPWVIIHVQDRAEYLRTLEVASTTDDIVPFAEFVLSQMRITETESA